MAKDTKKGRKARRQTLTVDRKLLERADRIYDQLSRSWYYVAEVQQARAALWPLIFAMEAGEAPSSRQLSAAMRFFEQLPDQIRKMIVAGREAPLTEEQWGRVIRTKRPVSLLADFVQPVTGTKKRGVAVARCDDEQAKTVEVYVNPGVSRAEAISGLSLVMGSMSNEGWWNDTFVKNGKSGASGAPAVADVQDGNGRAMQPTAA